MKSVKSSKKSIDNSSFADSTDIFKLAFENSSIGKSITNIDGTLKVNNAFCQMLGYSNREEMDKLNFTEITHPDDLDISKKATDDLIKNKGDTVCFEKRYLHKNGSIVWAEVYVVLHRDAQGNPLFFITDILDISERKLIEQQLQEKTEEIETQNEEYLQINEELLQTNHDLLKTKEIIEESERNYRFLTENIVDVVWVLDLETGKFIYVSPSVFKLRGYTAKEAMDQTIQESLTQQSVEKLNQILPLRIAEFNSDPNNSKIYYDEIEQPCKDGTKVWVEVISYYHVNKKNGHLEVIGTSRNINERKHIEKELLESNKRFETILASLNDAVYMVNPATHLISGFNDAALRIFGYSREELIQTKVESLFIDQEHFDRFRQQLLAIVDENGYYHLESEIRNKDGCRFTAEHSGRLIRDDAGNVINIVSVIRDITERKQIEKALRENEELFSKIFKSSPIPMSIANVSDGKLRDVNEAWCLLMGFSREEVIGHNAGELNIISAEEREKIRTEFLNNGHLNLIEGEIITKSGTKISILTSADIISIQDTPFSINLHIDITKRKQDELLLIEKNKKIEIQYVELQQLNEEFSQINEELKEAKEKAIESDRLKTAFLQNMSHEIRTPMNAIMGFSELLASNYNDKEKLEKFSGIISHRCNDLLDIINDILDISKIESGQLSVTNERFNLYVFFEELHTFFQGYQEKLGKQHIELNLQASYYSSNFEIITDQGKLKQIFINLISNAFKFTESGKIEGGFNFDDHYNLIFYLSDTGIGIPREKQDAVFERFVQLNQDTKKLISGTGLGLSIVKGLINLLGGKIWLESEPGKGTTFFFTLPFKSTRPLQNKATPMDEPKEYHFSNKMMLIVEDDYYNAEYLNEILAGTGFDIIETKCGMEAVKIAISQDLDIVLMDIRLPDIDGYEATRQIRKYKPNLKIIAQTAYASLDEKKIALEAGCNDYISKPIKKDLLLTMIGKQLTSVDY